VAVLEQALADAESITRSAVQRRATLTWMQSEQCAFWCAVAGLSHAAFVAGAARYRDSNH